MEEERRRNAEAWEECACKCIAETKRRGRVRRRWKTGWVKEGEYNCDWKFFLFRKLFFLPTAILCRCWNFWSWCVYRWLPEPSLSSILLPKCHFFDSSLKYSVISCTWVRLRTFLTPYLLFVPRFPKFTCCCTFLTRILKINSPTVPDMNVIPSLW